MAYITGSVIDSLGTLPFSLSAGTQLTMSIENPLPGASYFGLETFFDSNGQYTTSTPRNLSGSFVLGSGITDIIYDNYKMGAVVKPGGGLLTFIPAVGINANTLKTRGTANYNAGGDFASILANGYSARVSRSNGVTEASSAIVSSIQTLPMLQNASFLYIPSGYASGVAFSELSTNDYGDLSFTRASSATRTLSGGIIDSARTNFIRNSTMQGASTSPSTLPTNWVSTLNGLTQSVVSIGTENGLPYVDIRFNGTATSTISTISFDSNTQIVASNGQTWVSSFWIKEISAPTPPLSYIMIISERDSSGGFLQNSTQGITISSTLTRNIFTRTNVNASTARITNSVSANLTNGASYDFTIRIAAPQLELGLQATDWIPTTNSARTTFAGITQNGTTGGNISRLDYSYGSDPALLLEPQRTNTIRNSTMMSASVAGNILPSGWAFLSNGITSSVVGLGYENNLPYIDLRTFGTASSTFFHYSLGANTDAPATSGSRQVFSTWIKTISSSLPPTSTLLIIPEYSSSGTFIRNNSVTINPTSTLQRFVFTASISDPSASFASPILTYGVSNGQRYDFTTRIAAPQLESGSFVTTWIPTYLSSATRLADTFTRNNIFTNGLITSGGGTWYVELRNNVVYTRDNSGAGINLDDITGFNNGFVLRNGETGRLLIQKLISGTLTTLFTTTTDAVKIAIKWNGTTADVFVNGVKQVSATAFTTVALQNFITGMQVPVFIQAMALYPQPLSNVDSGVLTGANYYTSYAGMAQALNYTIS